MWSRPNLQSVAREVGLAGSIEIRIFVLIVEMVQDWGIVGQEIFAQ